MLFTHTRDESISPCDQGQCLHRVSWQPLAAGRRARTPGHICSSTAQTLREALQLSPQTSANRLCSVYLTKPSAARPAWFVWNVRCAASQVGVERQPGLNLRGRDEDWLTVKLVSCDNEAGGFEESFMFGAQAVQRRYTSKLNTYF